MSLFSKRWQLEHWLPLQPPIDEDANHEPVHGDVLAFDSEVGKFVSATPPVQPDIGLTIADQELVWWDATDAQLEPVSAITVVSSAASYGSLSVLDGAVAQAVTGTPDKLTAFTTDGPSSYLVPANATDDITVGVGGAGDYMVTFSASFSYVVAATVQFRLRVDAVESALGGQVEVLNAGDIVNVTFSGLVTLADAEVVTVYVEADADNNITVIDAQLVLNRIHD